LVYFIASKFAMESDKVKEYADFIIKNCKMFFKEMEDKFDLMHF